MQKDGEGGGESALTMRENRPSGIPESLGSVVGIQGVGGSFSG